MDNIGQKDELITARYGITAVVSGKEFDSILHSRVADVSPGDLKSCREVEDGGSKLGVFPAQADGIGSRSGADVEQMRYAVPIENR
jgi:hypothetical protein